MGMNVMASHGRIREGAVVKGAILKGTVENGEVENSEVEEWLIRFSASNPPNALANRGLALNFMDRIKSRGTRSYSQR